MRAGDTVVRLGLDDVLTRQDKRSASLRLTPPINKSRKTPGDYQTDGGGGDGVRRRCSRGKKGAKRILTGLGI